MHIVRGRTHDLGDGFMVRRMLPSADFRAIGPFVFLDHLGPVTLPPGRAMDVRPHPHIGLATVTYLWQGRVEHRDSIGSVQVIEPGAVNWMATGRGIVHSERTPAADRTAPRTMHGLQFWVALPADHAEDAPSFTHVDATSLPRITRDDVDMTVIAGTAFGATSPAPAAGPTVFLDVHLAASAALPLPDHYEQLAVYVIDGELQHAGDTLGTGTLAILDAGDAFRARGDCHLVVFGGDALDGPRALWWNFVARDEARLERARQDWQADRMGHVAGDDERIPLPERRRPATVLQPR